MNELLLLLERNDVFLTGKLSQEGELIGELICVLMEKPPGSDGGPVYCTMRISDEDSKRPVKDLIRTHFQPCVEAIKRNQLELRKSR